MAASSAEEDPLVAALPPATDYLTYLTLLEYQLKPRNLHVLNRLLSQDDGKLAREIGWDLVSRVVAMAAKVPEDVKTCLDIIARRGNPREVLIRISEQLESFKDSAEDNSEADWTNEEGKEEEEELPTFAGEAQRIHLGDMKLDGLSILNTDVMQEEQGEAKDQPENLQTDPETSVEDAALHFEYLLDTLGIVLTRIKTQHPSRFYATALPAVLRAYRTLDDKTQSTLPALKLLEKLSGKGKPVLPPRTSSVQNSERSTQPQESSATNQAPAPDPEAEDRLDELQATSSEDNAITRRLLQAVMVEVLDEFANSLKDTNILTFSWTVRMRESLQPDRSVPGRATEAERWQSDEHLKLLESLLNRSVALSQHLGLDIENTFKTEIVERTRSEASTTLTSQKESTSDPSEPSEPSDYPTSPSDIPFSTSGLILLFAANMFHNLNISTSPLANHLASVPTFGDVALVMLHLQKLQAASPETDGLNCATIDAILLLYYLSLIRTSAELSPHYALNLFPKPLMILLNYAAALDDELLCDGAHGIAKMFFHSCPDEAPKIHAIETLIKYFKDKEPRCASLVIAWLKDELSAFGQPPELGQMLPLKDGVIHGIDPIIFQVDAELCDLLFSVPNIDQTGTDVEAALRPHLLLYIATLNLYCILRAKKPELVLSQAEKFVDGMERATLALKQTAEADEGSADTPDVDLWAFEDALNRVKALRQSPL